MRRLDWISACAEMTESERCIRIEAVSHQAHISQMMGRPQLVTTFGTTSWDNLCRQRFLLSCDLTLSPGQCRRVTVSGHNSCDAKIRTRHNTLSKLWLSREDVGFKPTPAPDLPGTELLRFLDRTTAGNHSAPFCQRPSGSVGVEIINKQSAQNGLAIYEREDIVADAIAV